MPNDIQAHWQGLCGSEPCRWSFAHYIGATSLPRKLTKGEGVSQELRHTTDLALHSTKQVAHAVCCLTVAMLATERHLLLNLLGLKEKERAFLLDSPVSPTELFGTTVEVVVQKFREVKVKSAVY